MHTGRDLRNRTLHKSPKKFTSWLHSVYQAGVRTFCICICITIYSCVGDYIIFFSIFEKDPSFQVPRTGVILPLCGPGAKWLIVDTKGTKEPVYSKDAGRYAKACLESRGIATVP